MKRVSIAVKMQGGISLPIILILAVSGLLIMQTVGKSMNRLTQRELSSASLAASYQVSDFFNIYLKGAQQSAANIEMERLCKSLKNNQRFPTAEGYAAMKQTLDNLAASDGNIQAVWLGDFATSQITQSDNYTSPEGWDITKRPWYRVKETRAPVLTAPYIDASTQELIVTAAAPVFDSAANAVIGAVGYDFKLDQLVKMMSAYKIGESGFIILCTDEGEIIYHPDAGNIGQAFSQADFSENIKQAVQSGSVGYADYTMGGQPVCGSLNLVGDTGWMVLSGLPRAEAQSPVMSVMRMLFLVFGGGIVLIILLSTLLARGFARPLKKLSHAAGRIARGELDVEIGCRQRDEIGEVAEAFSETVLRLKGYINYIDEISQVLCGIAQGDLVFSLKHDYAGEFSKIKDALLQIKGTLVQTLSNLTETSSQVSAGADQVASSAQALSSGATEQASSVEQLTATVIEISDHVRENAQRTVKASAYAAQMSGEIEQSNGQMQKMTQAMQEISRSSGEIGKIIKTIEEISMQTNMLALNAAVEAARAGASGKGFAIVAQEVRSLASRSSAASKNTSELLEGTLEAVENGHKIAQATAGSLQRVVEGARQVKEIVGEISVATNEQADSISQVTLGLDQISAVVQTNSATAEQSAAASEELSGQARALMEMSAQFHLDADERQAAR